MSLIYRATPLCGIPYDTLRPLSFNEELPPSCGHVEQFCFRETYRRNTLNCVTSVIYAANVTILATSNISHFHVAK